MSSNWKHNQMISAGKLKQDGGIRRSEEKGRYDEGV